MSNRVLLSERPCEGQVLCLYSDGPFILVELNRIPVGRVRNLCRLLSTPDLPGLDSCIRLPGFVLLLTDAETASISAWFASHGE
jgi:hypothetical protein